MSKYKNCQKLALILIIIQLIFSCNGCKSLKKSDKDYKHNNAGSASYSEPTNGIVNNEGVDLYYEIVGSGKDTILFLHGTPSTMYAFVNDLNILSGHFTLIFFDQRGGGRSSLILNADSLTWQENVKDIEVVRMNFGIEKLNLMGISWGSALAVLYANEFPANIKSLVLFPTTASNNPDIPENAEPLEPFFDSIMERKIEKLLNKWETSDNPIAVCEEYWSIVLPKCFHDTSNINKIKGSFCKEPPEVLRYTMKVSEYRMQSLGDYDLKPILKNIKVPSLIIKGKSTPWMYPEWSEEWAAYLPNSRMLWVDEAGLFPWIEKPDIITEACLAFYNGGWPKDAETINTQIHKE